MKRKRIRIIERTIAWILCVALLIQVTPTYAAEPRGKPELAEFPSEEGTDEYSLEDGMTTAEDGGSAEEALEEAIESQEDVSAGEAAGSEEEQPLDGAVEDTLDPQDNLPAGDALDPQENATEDLGASEITDFTDVYENGIIKIYNLAQLEAIGSGQSVHLEDIREPQFGTGKEVTEDGTETGTRIQYGLGCNYQLMNEIELSSENMWRLPDGFTGTFTGSPSENEPLYDKSTDTIYVYNNYQLQLIASENAEKEPVMSMDMMPEQLGIGQFLYKDGAPVDESVDAAQEYLTYSKAHRYVLAMNFTEKMPEIVAKQVASGEIQWLEGEDAGGRSNPGQLVMEIDGKKYILIGNASQLQAIGSDKYVTPRLYIFHKPSLVGSIVADPYYVPYYPGDADLGLTTVATKSATTHKEGIPSREEMDKIDGAEYKYYKAGKENELPGLDVSDSKLLEGLLSALGDVLGHLIGGNNTLCGGVRTFSWTG